MAVTPDILTLDEDEQLALLGVMLRIIDRSLSELRKGSKRQRASVPIKESRRDELRCLYWRTQNGKNSHDPLPMESFDVLQKQLRSVRTEAHALQLVIAAANWEPWIEGIEGESAWLPREPRRLALKWAGTHLPGRITEARITEIDKILIPLVRRRRGFVVGAALGAGAVAGLATAGLAAPAIGGAIGATMGLSGAAATSAGLAALGGGSLAAGGFGMAGGTALIGALGVVGGGGLGAAFGNAGSRAAGDDDLSALKQEARALRALVTVGSGLSPETRQATISQGTLIELNIADLLRRKALDELRASPKASTQSAALMLEIERNAEIRRSLKTMPKFEVI